MFLILVAMVIMLGTFGIWWTMRPDSGAIDSLKKVREDLRGKGYKAELSDFNLSVSPDVLAREIAITNCFDAHIRGVNAEHPNLMTIIGSNSVIAVVQEPTLKLDNPRGPNGVAELSWDELSEQLRENQEKVDAAVAAVNSGPISFNLDSKGGFGILLPHLAVLKNLSHVLAVAAITGMERWPIATTPNGVGECGFFQ